jgi:hypothetical protein
MINDNMIALTLSFSRPGVRRVVPKSKTQVAVVAASGEVEQERPDADAVHVAKSIMDSPQLRAIASLDGFTRARIASLAVPAPMLKSGVYMINVDLVEQAYAYLESQAEARARLIDEFIAAYPELQAKAKDDLKGLYDPRQYPAAETLRRSFAFSWNLREWSVSGKLKNLSKAIYDKEVEKAQAEISSMTQAIRDALAVSMSGLVNHLVDRLGLDGDGDAKRFEAGTVTKLQEFLDTYYKRTPGGDADALASLVEKAKGVLNGVDVKMIKSDTAIKDRVAQGFAEIKAALDAVPAVAAKSRAIAIGDEEV